jgi:hypothetical protein
MYFLIAAGNFAMRRQIRRVGRDLNGGAIV